MSGGCDVLVVDDERALARNMQTYLTRHGHAARCAGSGAEALAALEGGFAPGVVLLDVRLPDADGIELLPRIRALAPAARAVVMTGYASVPTAVLAIKAGADDYLAKPVVLGELPGLLDRLRCAAPAAAVAGAGGLAAILGKAPATRELRERVRRLLEVERRSGQVARALHQGSDRAGGPFVELNCTALPEP